MPGKKSAFVSKKQQGFMFVHHPKTAKKMADDAKKAGKPVVAKRGRKAKK